MTEYSPLVSFTSIRSRFDDASDEERYAVKAKQGIPLPAVELRLLSDDGHEAPWDGHATGELQLRGSWVASQYFDDDRSAASYQDGWLETGDVGTVDPLGYVQVVDRTKDLLNSGGEWTSSVELENRLMSHPSIREACVVAVLDERWQERPLAFGVPIDSGEPPVSAESTELLSHYVPKWCIRDRFQWIAEVPKTSVGKFDKKLLRLSIPHVEDVPPRGPRGVRPYAA